MYLDKYIEDHGKQTDYPIFDDGIYKDIIFPTNDLFLAQFKGMNFNAVDIVVKYLAIENYYGLNDFGFNLYKKMQMLRTGKNWNDRFISLIKSVEKSYDDDSKIETDLNYSIHDGAHRTALALFHNKKNVPVRLFNTSIYRRSYDLSWFYENLFTKEELEIIKNKLIETSFELLEKISAGNYSHNKKYKKQMADEAVSKVKTLYFLLLMIEKDKMISNKMIHKLRLQLDNISKCLVGWRKAI